MDKGKIVPLTQFYYKQVSKVYGILACTLTHTHTFSVSPSLLTFPRVHNATAYWQSRGRREAREDP